MAIKKRKPTRMRPRLDGDVGLCSRVKAKVVCRKCHGKGYWLADVESRRRWDEPPKQEFHWCSCGLGRRMHKAADLYNSARR